MNFDTDSIQQTAQQIAEAHKIPLADVVENIRGMALEHCYRPGTEYTGYGYVVANKQGKISARIASYAVGSF